MMNSLPVWIYRVGGMPRRVKSVPQPRRGGGIVIKPGEKSKFSKIISISNFSVSIDFYIIVHNFLTKKAFMLSPKDPQFVDFALPRATMGSSCVVLLAACGIMGTCRQSLAPVLEPLGTIFLI